MYRFSEVEHLKTKLSRLLRLPFKIRIFRISLFRMVTPKCGVTRYWVSCFSWVWQVCLEPSCKDCVETNSQDEKVFGVVGTLLPDTSKD